MFGHLFPLKLFDLQLLSLTESAGLGDLSSTACNYPVVAGKMKEFCPKKYNASFLSCWDGNRFYSTPKQTHYPRDW